MKLLYTDINHDMTEILVNQAAHAAEAGWRIFILLQTLYLLKKSVQY